jgi:hypothetical protein
MKGIFVSMRLAGAAWVALTFTGGVAVAAGDYDTLFGNPAALKAMEASPEARQQLHSIKPDERH